MGEAGENIPVGGPGGITVAGWKLYYGDGSIASSVTGQSWQDCPSTGVQSMIVFYIERYRIWQEGQLNDYPYRDLYTGADYYWQYGAGSAEDAHAAGAENVKLGELIGDADFRAIYERAHQDMTLDG